MLSLTSIAFGQSVTDAATVTNLGQCSTAPSGTVTFQVSPDGGITWYDFGTAKTLSGSGTATSDPYSPAAAGGYSFRANFGGDAHHHTSQSADTDEPVTVGRAPTSVATRLSSSLIRLGSAVTDAVTLRSTAAGSAGGTWTVEASKNWSFSPSIVVDTGTVGAIPFTATIVPFTPTSTGMWFFRGTYSGDTNFSGSASGTMAEVVLVTQ